MLSFGKKSPRRLDIRRSRTVREGAWYRRLARPLGFWGGVGALLTATVATLILQAGGQQLGLRPGQLVQRPITARVQLEVLDQQQTTEKKIRAAESSPNYYQLDVSLLEDIRGRLAQVIVLARANQEDPGRLREAAAQNRVVLDEQGAAELQRLAGQDAAAEFERYVDAATRVLRSKPLVDPPEQTPGVRLAASRSILVDPEAARERSERLVFTTESDAVQRVIGEAASVFPEPLRASMAATIRQILASAPDDKGPPFRPLYRFDTNRTVEVGKQAQDSVPPQYRVYPAGEPIAQGVLTPEMIKLLERERQAYREAAAGSGLRWWGRFGARTLLVFVIVLGVVAYVWRYHGQVFRSGYRWLATSLAMLGVLGVTRSLYLADLAPHVAVGAQGFAAALLGIVYSHPVVFAVCGAMAVLMTMAVEQGISFLLVLLAVSGTMVFSLREVRRRGKVVAVGVVASLVALLTTLAAELLNFQPLQYAFRVSAWAALSTLMAAFIMEGILPAIERAFSLATGMTLLEWCDANKKLLRMMAAEAPGTFNHSMIVANLAEAAAGAIGANGLLARCGAYYHDIGKINKPGYFVENQVAGISRHDRLSPAMSLLIIVGHVKDGIEMAKEYGLPKPLHPFIAEHHGTTLVEYFYHAATKARRESDPAVSESEFRYPGPKPQSRETAIVMLCDGVEGAVRAMAEPTPNRIETVVSELAQKRLMDGQFDECDLTFRELALIERTLISRLCSIYHARVAYPERVEAAS